MSKSQTRIPFRPRSGLLAALFAALIGAACAPMPAREPLSCPVCPEATPTARPIPPAAPMQADSWQALPGWEDDAPGEALPALQHSCRALASKPQWPLWRTVCEGSRQLSGHDPAQVRRFFETNLTPYRLTLPDATHEGLITGYYEPLLRGAKKQDERYAHAVLGVPPDLLTIDLSAVLPDLKNMRLRGRLQGNKVVPYLSRAEISSREKRKDFPGRVLLWVEDAVELFFLQIQGSGRVQLPDGSLVRLGYADQNGHPYQSIGRLLIERGELRAEQASMQGIQSWARENPDKLDELLNANPSYVFFRELPATIDPDEGPIGALGVPLTPGRSLAVDPRHVPLGAPVFLSTTYPASGKPLRRLMLAQDTGGAIRGIVRADFFWGFGAQAGAQAGRMKQQGQMWVLLPPGAAPK